MGITNAKYLHIDHVFFNQPIDHQSTSNDRLKPVLTTGLVNMHIDRSIANLGNESFRPGHFGLGRFGLILRWVVSAYFGGSFRPDIPLTPAPAHMLQFSFMISYTLACVVMQSQKNHTQLRKDGNTYTNTYK